MNEREWLAEARLLAMDRMPYMADMIFLLVPRPKPGLGTMASTADAVLYYDPVLANEWTTHEAAGVLLHEAFHVLREHVQRANEQAMDAKLGNIAMDLEINDDLEGVKGSGTTPIKLPGKPLLPKTYGFKDGMMFEEYYHLLKKMAEKPQPTKPGPGSGQCGGCAGNPAPGEPKAEGEGQGGGQGQGEGKGKGDSAGGGEGNPGDQGAGGAGRSELEIEIARQGVAEAISSAANSQTQGTIPQSLRRWADQKLKPPKIPWATQLARKTRFAAAYRPGAMDSTYTRFSRHQAGIGFGAGRPVLPAMRTPIIRAWIVADTSGSMGTSRLERVVAEADGILRAIGAEATFVACDAAIHEVVRVTKIQEILPRLTGGGGTSFMPVFEAAKKARPRPEVLIYLTDGEGHAPSEAPQGIATIWCIIGPAAAPAHWGDVVRVDDE